MPKTNTLEKHDLVLAEFVINDNVTLVSMQDLVTFDFYVKGTGQYLAHFMNVLAFGQEFAILQKGHNLFTLKNSSQQTDCYLMADAALTNVQSGTVGPCTGPIVIPPRPSDL